MTEGLDFRSDKSDSIEGDRRAGARWDSYHLNLDGEVLAEAFQSAGQPAQDYPDFVPDDIAADAMEESDLIGFWVA